MGACLLCLVEARRSDMAVGTRIVDSSRNVCHYWVTAVRPRSVLAGGLVHLTLLVPSTCRVSEDASAVDSGPSPSLGEIKRRWSSVRAGISGGA